VADGLLHPLLLRLLDEVHGEINKDVMSASVRPLPVGVDAGSEE
jgi:hypothetical protein